MEDRYIYFVNSPDENNIHLIHSPHLKTLESEGKIDMRKKIPEIGIITVILYFLVVTLYLVTKTETALTLWETVTIISAPVFLFVLLELANMMEISTICKNAMLAFLSCTCSITALAHIVNITVTRSLIADGVNVPIYFRIGFWPSVEMAADYLAWGFFMGLAFLTIGFCINDDNKYKAIMKKTVVICGFLCLCGFLGAVFMNENLWYLAPMGYGPGVVVICIQMIKVRKFSV